jgi:hypothetical protein
MIDRGRLADYIPYLKKSIFFKKNTYYVFCHMVD